MPARSGIEVVITALTRKHQGFMETFRLQTRMNTGFFDFTLFEQSRFSLLFSPLLPENFWNVKES